MTIDPAPSARLSARAALSALGSGVIEAVRILFFVSPFLLSLPQLARADSNLSTSTTLEYVETLDTPAPGAGWGRATALARFGPFSVVSPNVAELNGVIDQTTPDQVRRMLASFPSLGLIRMVECPGTEDDEANLEVGRLIHRAGISTFVPADGSVRSGGVDLFLAGVHHAAERGAEFGVHSWEDLNGREARDVPASDPAHQVYLHYYEDVGMSAEEARAFYAFSNRAAFEDIHYMTGTELAEFHFFN